MAGTLILEMPSLKIPKPESDVFPPTSDTEGRALHSSIAPSSCSIRREPFTLHFLTVLLI